MSAPVRIRRDFLFKPIQEQLSSSHCIHYKLNEKYEWNTDEDANIILQQTNKNVEVTRNELRECVQEFVRCPYCRTELDHMIHSIPNKKLQFQEEIDGSTILFSDLEECSFPLREIFLNYAPVSNWKIILADYSFTNIYKMSMKLIDDFTKLYNPERISTISLEDVHDTNEKIYIIMNSLIHAIMLIQKYATCMIFCGPSSVFPQFYHGLLSFFQQLFGDLIKTRKEINVFLRKHEIYKEPNLTSCLVKEYLQEFVQEYEHLPKETLFEFLYQLNQKRCLAMKKFIQDTYELVREHEETFIYKLRKFERLVEQETFLEPLKLCNETSILLVCFEVSMGALLKKGFVPKLPYPSNQEEMEMMDSRFGNVMDLIGKRWKDARDTIFANCPPQGFPLIEEHRKELNDIFRAFDTEWLFYEQEFSSKMSEVSLTNSPNDYDVRLSLRFFQGLTMMKCANVLRRMSFLISFLDDMTPIIQQIICGSTKEIYIFLTTILQKLHLRKIEKNYSDQRIVFLTSELTSKKKKVKKNKKVIQKTASESIEKSSDEENQKKKENNMNINVAYEMKPNGELKWKKIPEPVVEAKIVGTDQKTSKSKWKRIDSGTTLSTTSTWDSSSTSGDDNGKWEKVGQRRNKKKNDTDEKKQEKIQTYSQTVKKNNNNNDNHTKKNDTKKDVQVSSASVQVSSDNKQISSASVQVSPDNKQVSSASVQVSSDNKQMSSASVQTQSNIMQTNPVDKQMSSANVQVSSENKQMSSASVQVSSENKQVSSASVQVSSENKQVSSASVQTQSNIMQMNPVDKQMSSASVQTQSNNVQTFYPQNNKNNHCGTTLPQSSLYIQQQPLHVQVDVPLQAVNDFAVRRQLNRQHQQQLINQHQIQQQNHQILLQQQQQQNELYMKLERERQILQQQQQEIEMQKMQIQEQMNSYPRVNPETGNYTGNAYEASLLCADGKTLMYGIFVPQQYTSAYHVTRPRIHFD